MPSFFERLAARAAFLHARRVFSRFERTLVDVERVQQAVLARVLASLARGEYARKLGLHAVRSDSDFRRAAPLVRYDDLRPYIERVRAGEHAALFHPRQRIEMFATSSGTTSTPKYIPVTPAFVSQYRRGWNTFGLRMLSDHPAAVLRAILQGSGRYDESFTSRGIPCGAITGLLARAQKGIVRRFYVGCPEIAYVKDARARYYTLARFGVVRDVAFAVTANPATLIRIAQTADEESETLIRDVHDGTLSASMVDNPALNSRLLSRLRPAVQRAKELSALRARHGGLRPRDYWNAEFLACWTGGSMGHYLGRLADWYGPLPVRDIGLLASEGRVTIPLQDNIAAGVLDVQAAYFEFIPVANAEDEFPPTLRPGDLQVGQDYIVVLTNDAGLVRYRLDDVVRVRGWHGGAPVLEFLHRAGRVSSVAGEKLTENQVVEAVRVTCTRLGLKPFDFVLAPRWADPPHYALTCALPGSDELEKTLDLCLSEQNDEYRSRRASQRLGRVRAVSVPAGAFASYDRRLAERRGSTPEQYKRACLLTAPGSDAELVTLAQQ